MCDADLVGYQRGRESDSQEGPRDENLLNARKEEKKVPEGDVARVSVRESWRVETRGFESAQRLKDRIGHIGVRRQGKQRRKGRQ